MLLQSAGGGMLETAGLLAATAGSLARAHVRRAQRVRVQAASRRQRRVTGRGVRGRRRCHERRYGRRVGLQQVEQREEEHPHDVDEVPVEAEVLDRPAVVHVVTVVGPHEQEARDDESQDDVDAVEARRHVV